MRSQFLPSLLAALALGTIVSACAPQETTMTKDEVRNLDKADFAIDWCAEFGWYDDQICDDFCLQPDPDCEIHGPCGDGTIALCEMVQPECPEGLVIETVNGCFGECVDPVTCLPPPTVLGCGDGTLPVCEIWVPECPQGLVRETVNGCFGECVDPVSCEAPCEDDLDCNDGFCGWAEDNSTRVCKEWALPGDSCEGFVLPSARATCAPGLHCLFSEPTHDVPGTCVEPLHSGQCGDGSNALCLMVPEPCEDGLVHEIVNGCYGECVSPLTCLPPPQPL